MALLNNESSKELVKKYNLPPGPATNKGIYEKLLLEGKLDAVENPNYVAPEETTYDIPRGWPKYPVFPDSGDVPGPPIQFEELKPDSVKAGYTFTDPNMIGEVDEYFYHGDHISSVVLVTLYEVFIFKRLPVVHITRSEHEVQKFALFIAYEVKFEPEEPSHGTLASLLFP